MTTERRALEILLDQGYEVYVDNAGMKDDREVRDALGLSTEDGPEIMLTYPSPRTAEIVAIDAEGYLVPGNRTIAYLTYADYAQAQDG